MAVKSWRDRGWQLGLVIWLGLMGAIADGKGDPIFAQVIPDTTLGSESSIVTPLDPDFSVDRIDGGAVRGNNLFHSFQQFNVTEGRGAYFFSPDNIQNILARVTGENRSEILGTIGTFGNSSPNLFLINPNGIIFGPDASLDVGGSFVATTANAIQFGDQGFFSASSPDTLPLLTINPLAFQFNQVPHGAIVSSSITPVGLDLSLGADVFGLRVPDGQTLVLLGGDVSIDGGEAGRGGLTAFGGRVELGGVVGTGTVALNIDQNLLNLNFPDNVARANVSLTNEARVFLSSGGGGSVQIQAARLSMSGLSAIFSSTVGAKDGGDVFIQATDAVNVDNSAILTGVSTIFGDPKQATGKGGSITIHAKQLSVTSNLLFAPFALGQIGTNTFGVGNAGNITVVVERLILRNGGQLTTDSRSTGKAGNITVHASESVEASGTLDIATNNFASGLFSETFSKASDAGSAGNLTITTKQLVVQDNAAISTQTQGSGNGGKLEVITKHLLVESGGEVRAGTRDTGQGGTLIINASDSIDVVGINARGGPSGLFTATDGIGNGGDLTITTKKLKVLDGATVSASSFAVSSGRGGSLTIEASESTEIAGTSVDNFHSGIVAETGRLLEDINPEANIGEGGSLILKTGQLVIRDGAEVSTSTFGQGEAGDIQIQAGFLSLEDGASILSRSIKQGGGGSININVHSTLQANDSEISTSSTQSTGGAIGITAKAIRLEGDSDIKTNVFSGAGGGGNINLTADSIVALDDSDILAFARDGQGGNVTLNTPAFFGENYKPIPPSADPNTLDENDRVDINASGAVAGVVTLPDTSFIQNGLTELSENLIDTNSLIANSCIARSSQPGGSFVIKGAGGLPTRPGDASVSLYSTGSVQNVGGDRPSNPGTIPISGTGSTHPWQKGDPIVEPQGVYRLANGQLVISRECF